MTADSSPYTSSPNQRLPGAASQFARTLLTLPEAEGARLLAISLAQEASATERQRRAAVLRRLRGWLDLRTAESHALAAVYRNAFGLLTQEQRDVVMETESDAAMKGLHLAEFERLRTFATWLSIGERRLPAKPKRDFWRSLETILAINADAIY